jgi:capsular polysaccharide transport system permease protein
MARDFARGSYNSALTSLDQARAAVLKQQYFLSRSVQPNLPEDALFPKRWLIPLSVFLALLISYGIGWLIVAGFREHAA